MRSYTISKRYHYIPLTILVLLTVLISCGGSSGSGGGDEVLKPENLQLTINPVGKDDINPNGDGSGVVNFTFSARNATSYKINYGDGEILETSSTSASHTYVGSGLHDFTVYVSAYNTNGFISTSASFKLKINTAMLWADEFNSPGAPNSANWTHEIGNGDWGWGNNEKQYYTNRSVNSRVENGVLKITAKAESYEGFNYTSARLITKDKFEFKYGRVDIKAKLPEGQGTWPALWLLGANIDDVGWPACGEIDIMEHWGHIPTEVSSAIHTPSCYSGNCSNMRVGETTVSDYATEFHIYSMEWDENEIRFLLDDTHLYTYKPATKTAQNWPFDKPMFFIVNVAMGGDWFTIDPNFNSSTMEIDYIRVYQ
jgi:beta-glucanase (GH16 family)